MTLAIAKPTVHEMFSSGSRGTTTSNVFATMDNEIAVLQLVVTAQSGTNPTLDLVVQDGPTDSGPWSTLNTFTQITGATANVVTQVTRKPMPFIRAVGTVGGTATPLFTYTLNAVMYRSTSLTINTTSSGTAAVTSLTVTSADAAAATVGLNGATNPAFQVDASTALSATGLKIKSAAAASGVALSVISSGTNENLTIDAKGSGTINLNATGTGAVQSNRSTVVSIASAVALVVGPNGTTNPSFKVLTDTSSAATGLTVTAAAAAAGLAVAVISSGTNENLTIDAKGSGTISLNVTGTGNVVLGRAATGVSLAVTAGLTSSGSTGAGIGYATGAGGTVTQATDRTTGVTLSKLTGQITTNNASLAAGAEAEFTVTNTTVAATDTVILNITPGGTGTPFAYVSTVAAGSFKIMVTNLHASTADTSADVINYTVLKGVAA